MLVSIPYTTLNPERTKESPVPSPVAMPRTIPMVAERINNTGYCIIVDLVSKKEVSGFATTENFFFLIKKQPGDQQARYSIK